MAGRIDDLKRHLKAELIVVEQSQQRPQIVGGHVVLASHQQQLQGLGVGWFRLGVCEGRSRHGVRGERSR